MVLPWVLAAGVGWNYLTSKDLDDCAAVEKARRPLGDFWSGICCGLLVGLYAGLFHSGSLREAWAVVDRLAAWVRSSSAALLDGPGPAPKQDQEQLPPYQYPPSAGYVQPYPPQGTVGVPPGAVYYMPMQAQSQR
eukprot:gnl/TRDRNA2_/TRDRNA2_192177_c0_seq1.p1 gnl/TRDRNA2_/TRDRNA2_192177_c0~~gnl/TRDRNA2_/TRDRNA2_192177_c0_seq1.p1  ORF type:complete len:135 (+),score=13.56 gnl/TRDRNA2_/TRDRNA2_192177_c0_seq1:77-481(+)